MLLFSMNDLSGSKVEGRDLSIGRIGGFLFDPKTWKLEYLIARRGFWPLEKSLYLPVKYLEIPKNISGKVQVDLNHEDVEKLQTEAKKNILAREYSKHPIHYWRIGKFPKAIPWVNPMAINDVFKQRKENQEIRGEDTDNVKNLRYSADVKGYRVDAKDKLVGTVKDLVIDAELWLIRYVIIEGLNRKMMLPSTWVKNINSAAETLHLNLNRQMVLESPYVIA